MLVMSAGAKLDQVCPSPCKMVPAPTAHRSVLLLPQIALKPLPCGKGLAQHQPPDEQNAPCSSVEKASAIGGSAPPATPPPPLLPPAPPLPTTVTTGAPFPPPAPAPPSPDLGKPGVFPPLTVKPFDVALLLLH